MTIISGSRAVDEEFAVSSSVEFAVSGLRQARRGERSYRTQVLLGFAASKVVSVLQPGLLWTAFVALSIAIVLAFELVNSAIESMIGHLHPENAAEIKHAKDIAAGAVLIASSGALDVGVLMLVSILFRH